MSDLGAAFCGPQQQSILVAFTTYRGQFVYPQDGVKNIFKALYKSEQRV